MYMEPAKSAYQASGQGVIDKFPGQDEWPAKTPKSTPSKTTEAVPPNPSPSNKTATSSTLSSSSPPADITYRQVESLPSTQVPSASAFYSAYVNQHPDTQVVVHSAHHEPSAPPWQPHQTLDEAVGVALPVGLGNAARRLAAGAGGLALGTFAAGALEQALPPAGGVGTQVAAVLGTGLATVAGTALAAHGLAQVMDCKASKLVNRSFAVALCSGVLPAVIARTASSPSLAQAQARTASVIGQFVSHLVAGVASETVMQASDGVTRRARVVDTKSGGGLAQGESVFREWPVASALVYGGVGLVAEFALAPALKDAFASDQPAGTAQAAGSLMAQALAQTVLELYDTLVAMGLAHQAGLRLEAVPGRIGAVCENLCRLGQTLRRVIDFSGARAFITSPAQFLRMAEALYAGQPGTVQALRVARGVVDGLARLNGHFVQEAQPMRRAEAAWAAEFRPNYETFIGSAGSGLDLREVEDEPGAQSTSPGLRQRHQAGKQAAKKAEDFA